MSGCGECTLCCKLLGVDADDGSLLTPQGTWCQHCDPRSGCAIYEARPKSCRGFECLWLQSQSRPEAALPLSMRPDRSKVVIASEENGILTAHVDPSRPFAHRQGEIGEVILRLALQYPVVIVIGDERTAYGDKAVERLRDLKSKDSQEKGLSSGAGGGTVPPGREGRASG